MSPGRHLPAGEGAVVALDEGEPGSARPQHPDVRDRPVRGVVDEQVLLPVPVEVGDVELVAGGEVPPGHRVVVAGDEPEAVRAVVGQEAEILERPVRPVEDDHLVLAVAVEVADVELVAGLELPRARHPLDRAEHHLELRSVRAVDVDRVPAVDEDVVLAVAVEVARVDVLERVLGERLRHRLHPRVTDRAVRRRVAAHPAVDRRAVEPARPGAAALEEAGIVAVAPAGRLRRGGVARARARAGRNGCDRVHELAPLERGPVGVARDVRRAGLSARERAGVRAVLVGEPARPVPELVRHHAPAGPHRDDLEAAAAAAPEAGVVEDDDDEVVVGHPGVERVLHLRPRGGGALEPAVRPRAAEDVAERRVPDRRRRDRVVRRVGRRAVLVVDAGAHSRLRRDQVDPEDVVGRFVLVEVVAAEHAVQEKLLDFGVVGGLVPRGEAIAQDGDVLLRSGWTGSQDLRNAVGHGLNLLRSRAGPSALRVRPHADASRPYLQRQPHASRSLLPSSRSPQQQASTSRGSPPLLKRCSTPRRRARQYRPRLAPLRAKAPGANW